MRRSEASAGPEEERGRLTSLDNDESQLLTLGGVGWRPPNSGGKGGIHGIDSELNMPDSLSGDESNLEGKGETQAKACVSLFYAMKPIVASAPRGRRRMQVPVVTIASFASRTTPRGPILYADALGLPVGHGGPTLRAALRG
jgi:hypothetical protein